MSDKMKYYIILFLCLQCTLIVAQEEELLKAANQATRFVANGNTILVDEGNFPKAEGEYRKAISKNPEDAIAKYNLGNAYYNSEKYDEATQRFTEAAKVTDASKAEKHKAFHNQGNTYMEQKKYKEAVEAYKNALRNNPKDDQTRYNLALAKKMLEQQKQQNDQDQDKDNKDQDQDQDQNQDNQDQKEGDDKEEKKGDDGENKQDQKNEGDKDEEEKKDGEDKKDEEGEPKDDKKDKGDNKEGEEGEQKEQPQRPQGQLSPQQVKSLLEAMNNEEKKVQDKINAKKAQGSKVRTEKDW